MNTASVEFMDLRNDSTQFKAFADDCGFEDPCVGVPTSEGDECDDKCECDIREDWTKLLKAMPTWLNESESSWTAARDISSLCYINDELDDCDQSCVDGEGCNDRDVCQDADLAEVTDKTAYIDWLIDEGGKLDPADYLALDGAPDYDFSIVAKVASILGTNNSIPTYNGWCQHSGAEAPLYAARIEQTDKDIVPIFNFMMNGGFLLSYLFGLPIVTGALGARGAVYDCV
jgi:hypothetical protein